MRAGRVTPCNIYLGLNDVTVQGLSFKTRILRVVENEGEGTNMCRQDTLLVPVEGRDYKLGKLSSCPGWHHFRSLRSYR